MPLPLDDVRVLDFTRMMQGPYGTQMLGDLGAEIIKVEMPKTPDGRPDVRYGLHGGYTKTKEDSTFASSIFLSLNRNKKSITVDLKREKGKEIIRRLIKISDVIYENFRPDVMGRLGFSHEDCCKINPSIIYVSATGYGSDGPYEWKPGQDMLGQAMGGLPWLNANEEGRPVPVATSIADLLGGMNGAFGVLAALYYRKRTGIGQRVFVNLVDGIVAAQVQETVHFLNTGAEPQGRTTVARGHPLLPPPYGVYRTKDGYIAIAAGRHLPTFCRILGVPNVEEDPRFNTYLKRDENRNELDLIFEEALRKRTTVEWLKLMEAEDLWVAPVKTYPEVFSDPQVLHNQMVVTVDSPVGPLRLPGTPYKLSKTPAQVRMAPPKLGQHNDEVLTMIGYSPEEIEELRREEVI